MCFLIKLMLVNFVENDVDAKKLKPDYFDNASDEFVDFLERIGEEGVKRQEQSFWNIRERCQKLTSLIVAGVSGVTMWLIADGLRSAFFYETLGVTAVWFACGICMMFSCLFGKGRAAAFYPPDILYQDSYELNRVRRTRLIWLCDAYREINKACQKMVFVFNAVLIISSIAPVLGLFSVMLKWVMIEN